MRGHQREHTSGGMGHVTWGMRLRLGAATCVLLAGFSLVCIRVVALQWHPPVEAETAGQVRTDNALRGSILDREGRVLAFTENSFKVGIDPVVMKRYLHEEYRDEVAEADPGLPSDQLLAMELPEDELKRRMSDMVAGFAKLLQLSAEDVSRRFWERLGAAPGTRFIVIDRDVRNQRFKNIAPLMDKGMGLACDPTQSWIRNYPNHNLACHVIGFLSRIPSESEGIEWAMDVELRGRDGQYLFFPGSSGRNELIHRRRIIQDRVDGNDIQLTIDSFIQGVVESALAKAAVAHNPESITAVVVQPKTGEILAMANLPDFDPNDYGNAEADSRKNRAVTDFFEPGSMFKIVPVSGALEFGSARSDSVYFCENGYWTSSGTRPLRDSHGYGDLTVEEIIVHSSNIGTAKVAIDLGKENLFYFVRRFGFGTRPSIALRGVTPGSVRPLNDWSTLSMTRIPMGHEIAVSALQMVMAIATVANDGQRMKPQLVHSVRSQDGQVLWRYQPKVVDQPISPGTAAMMRRALAGVVERGTARRARLDGYRAGGKTGTAQYAENGVYPPGLWTSSFVGFAPVEDPVVSVIVVVDRPKGDYYGGTVAAPVFKEITEKILEYYQVPRRSLAPAGADLAEASPILD